ncbi:hypothetical protein E0F15_02255 [Frankia sp. B2]|nr:hypothetical protein E0F15_02255 [Frankia sp. B2]
MPLPAVDVAERALSGSDLAGLWQRRDVLCPVPCRRVDGRSRITGTGVPRRGLAGRRWSGSRAVEVIVAGRTTVETVRSGRVSGMAASGDVGGRDGSGTVQRMGLAWRRSAYSDDRTGPALSG